MGTLGFWRLAQADPEWIAVIDPDGVHHRAGDLLAAANRLVHGLRDLGLVEGEVVCGLVPNGIDGLVLYLAALQSGLRYTPINWHLTGSEIGHIIADSSARVFFVHENFAEEGLRAIAESGIEPGRCFAFGTVEGLRPASTLTDGRPSTTPLRRTAGAVMHYTSGTTGRPKGVIRPLSPLDPDDLAELSTGLAAMMGIPPGPPQVHLVTSPMYHAAVTLFAGAALHMGHTVVIMGKWDPEQALRLCERHRVTNTHMVPTHFKHLLALPPHVRAAYDLSSLTWVVHAAAPCPVPVKRAMLEWLGDHVYEYYAATEGGGTLATPADWREHPGTVGRPWAMSKLLIVDDDLQPVPPGTPGTIYMRTSGYDFEYKGDPEKTLAARLDDYFTVGDVGYLDREGFLYLCDRKADMIISGGVNIYPAEIENELMPHPKVADVAVFGIPDDEWGEQIKAVVQPAEGVVPGPELAAELLGSLEGRLAHMKWPKSFDFIETMPRDPSGKLLRRHLRLPYWKDRDSLI
ncbi:acyl-CoA synthetase [Sinosporangium siamense]|uniref:Acyl-CoA synthetase n=1 Tax=Sinosporangium siamense TaxID=1367973 RepID=A0A919RFT1_9ACTN|nr:acyl-CoA synthetase [Sinosporangium siamense]GII91106.1 acyl-CoA synthetase [Sinosporangium siamense]